MKSRFRSSMLQKRFESLLLIAIEKAIVANLTKTTLFTPKEKVILNCKGT